MLQINIEYKEINGHELDCFVLKNYLHKQLILLSQHFFYFELHLQRKLRTLGWEPESCSQHPCWGSQPALTAGSDAPMPSLTHLGTAHAHGAHTHTQGNAFVVC